MANPKESHLEAERLLRYIKGTI